MAQSIFKKIARGHAAISNSELFGKMLVIRNGRGRLTFAASGKPVTNHRNLNLMDNVPIPKGRPTDDRSQQRKKAPAIH